MDKKGKQEYTTLRIFRSTHERIKKLAASEQRNIEIVANRLLDEALAYSQRTTRRGK